MPEPAPADLEAIDFGEPEPAETPPAAQPTLAIIPPEIERDTFVPTLTISDKGKIHRVAANRLANRAQGQIIYAKAMKLLEKKIDEYADADATPDVATLSKLAASVETILAVGEMVYGPGKTPKAGEDLEALAIGMIRAATEGAAKGAGEDRFEERRKRMAALGRAKVVEEITEIEPKS